MRWARMRMLMSVGPPAGNGTMILTARIGNGGVRSDWGGAGPTQNLAVSATARVTARRADQTFIVSPVRCAASEVLTPTHLACIPRRCPAWRNRPLHARRIGRTTPAKKNLCNYIDLILRSALARVSKGGSEPVPMHPSFETPPYEDEAGNIHNPQTAGARP